MKKNIFKVSGLIIGLSLITPLFTSAQTVTASSSISIQVQSLLSQIAALELQLKTLVHSSLSSSSMPVIPAMGSSTPVGGDNQNMQNVGQGGMRCLPLARDLSIGSQGDDVSSLQQMLVNNGFLSASSTTGFFGAITAHAVMQFQSQFGVSASSTGFVGPITRNFLRGGCDMNQGQQMGSTTPSMWQNSSSTRPMPPMNNGTSTDGRFMHPMIPAGIPAGMNMSGSTTMPMQPCMQDSTSTDANNAASAVISFMHVILPGMQRPCPEVSGEMQQQ